jgi:hypothetical protein
MAADLRESAMTSSDRTAISVLLLGSALLCACCASPRVGREEAATARRIRQTVEDHMAAMTRGDVDGVLRNVMPDARSDLGPIDRAVVTARIGQRLSYELVSFHLMAVDGDVAVGKVESRQTPPSGPSQSVRMLQVYRLAGGEWRVWRVIALRKE